MIAPVPLAPRNFFEIYFLAHHHTHTQTCKSSQRKEKATKKDPKAVTWTTT